MNSHSLSSENDTKSKDCSQIDVKSVDQFQLVLYASKLDPALNGCDLAVLLELVDRYKKPARYKKGGGVTYPTSAGHLARETGRDVRNVQRALEKLTKRGLSILVEPGSGTRGNTYTFNFQWVREVAADIDAEKATRKKAKESRRRKRTPSNGEIAAASSDTLATAKSPPLRDLVTAKSPQLTSLAMAKSPPQTYGGPTSPYVGGATTTAYGLTPTQGGAPPKRRNVTIASTHVETVDGETVLLVNFETEDGTELCESIVLESSDADEQREGQRELEQLTNAAGIDNIDDSSELHGARLVVIAGGLSYRYEPPADIGVAKAEPANDNEPHVAPARANDYAPAGKRPPRPSFFEVVARNPISEGGWPKRDDDDDEEAEARAGMYFGADDDEAA